MIFSLPSKEEKKHFIVRLRSITSYFKSKYLIQYQYFTISSISWNKTNEIV